MAYFQIMMIFFGSLFLLFGISIFVSVIQKKGKYRHWFTATVCSIREGEGLADENGVKGKQYYPVFEGVGLDGKKRQYECQTASTDLNHYKIGARFEVTCDESKEGFVSLKGDDKTDMIIGMVLCLIGGLMIFPAIFFIKFAQLTFVVWALTVIIGVLKFSKYFKPKHLRETIAQFKNRRSSERLMEQQSKPELSQDYILQKNIKFEDMRRSLNKITLVIGFVILCLGGIGYNYQLRFIENSNLEYSAPCGLEMGQDCQRNLLVFQDILSILPLKMRPPMEGIYKSKFDPDDMIVSYRHWTPAPYFILMGSGVLILFGAVRKNNKKTI